MTEIEKTYEFVKCECGHMCPIDFAIIDEDAIYTCPDCYIEAMNEWINIEDEMPEMNKGVLITSGDGTIVDVAMWYEDKDGEIRWQFAGTHSDLIIKHRYPTHWKPIKYMNETRH